MQTLLQFPAHLNVWLIREFALLFDKEDNQHIALGF